MHPSRAIRGRHSQLLAGRSIVIGVSGSIAAVEVPRIVRELIRHGAEVQAVMSPEATRIVSEEALAFATGHRPIVQLTGQVEHVTLLGPGEGQADLLLIAPATANTISKIAHGIDDTPVTSCASVALGGGVPILLAPAMHAHMASNPAVQENLQRLERWGVEIIRSQAAEGEEKLAAPEEVAAAVLHRLGRPPWSGRKVLVIGGASREPIDEVRAVTNMSSGATAVSLATQAHFRGARVELWAGSLEVPLPPFLSVRRWGSVGDLWKLAHREQSTLRSMDAVFVPAALSDFTLEPRGGKIASKGVERLRLDLTRTPKLLPELRRIAQRPTMLIGFKLEVAQTEEQLFGLASSLLKEGHLDWVVANDRSSLGGSETSILVVGTRGERHWIAGPKAEVMGKLLDDLGRSLDANGPSVRQPPVRHRRSVGIPRAKSPRAPSPGAPRGRRR